MEDITEILETISSAQFRTVILTGDAVYMNRVDLSLLQSTLTNPRNVVGASFVTLRCEYHRYLAPKTAIDEFCTYWKMGLAVLESQGRLEFLFQNCDINIDDLGPTVYLNSFADQID